MSDEMSKKIIEMANRDYFRLAFELSDGETFNTGHLAAYIGALFQVTFGNMERAIGLKRTRASFTHAIDFMVDVMIDGAYDKENDRIKG